MKSLLALARLIDAVNDRGAGIAKWAVFLACAISAGNAFVRYGLSISSNAFLEIQWYLFAYCVMLGASQVLRVNEHVRVDILYAWYPTRLKVVVDLLGLTFFLIPVCLFIAWSSMPVFLNMLHSGEMSSNAGGLIRWPAMLTIPLGMGLLVLQAVAEIIKRVAWLAGAFEMDTHYERPLQ
ncbi:MAG: TRAP transporter small permease subunit [Hydrogenophaga sp.]|nr:TRAP transporter small permease subunit [Hydrogenophaga sp.]